VDPTLHQLYITNNFGTSGSEESVFRGWKKHKRKFYCYLSITDMGATITMQASRKMIVFASDEAKRLEKDYQSLNITQLVVSSKDEGLYYKC